MWDGDTHWHGMGTAGMGWRLPPARDEDWWHGMGTAGIGWENHQHGMGTAGTG